MERFTFKGMKCLMITFFLSVLFFDLSAQTPETAIREAMAEQERCWNTGDLDCFMKSYWQSEALVFVGSKGLTYGWQQTLDNYKASYPDKAAMGTLKFTLEIIEPLSDDYWFVVGKWQLTREEDTPNGHFSLIWRNLDGEWVIVADHSS